MVVSTCELGAQRDEQIVQLVSQLRYLTALQVARALFGGRRRVAARRLLRLTQIGRLRSARLNHTSGPLVYFAPPRQLTRAAYEALDLAELYCRLWESRPPTASVDRFDTELRLKAIRRDAFTVLRDGAKEHVVFLEWDRGTCTLEHVVAKIPAYERYAQSGDYRNSGWWRPGVDVHVVIAVPSERFHPITRAAAGISGRLKPIITKHTTLLRNPWEVVFQR